MLLAFLEILLDLRREAAESFPEEDFVRVIEGFYDACHAPIFCRVLRLPDNRPHHFLVSSADER
jgi:hypothetical protein